MKLNIILRTHDGNNVHSGNRFVSETKSEIIIRCVKSLLISLNQVEDQSDISLTIVDDHSSSSTVDWIQNAIEFQPFKTSIIHLEEIGNNASMKKCYELGLQSTGDLIYFVEDDYMHKPEAINAMINAYSNFSSKLGGAPIVIAPYDDPLDYMPNRVMPTRIVPGSDRHWRQNFHTTFTMMLPKWILLHFWDKFMEMTNYGNGVCEDNTINLIYTKFDTVLFSPMPWLATHMCDIEPTVGDWKELWTQLK